MESRGFDSLPATVFGFYDPIASERNDSTYQRAQAEAVAADLLKGSTRVEPGKRKVVETRR